MMQATFVVTLEQAQLIERKVIESGVSAETLMSLAAKGIALSLMSKVDSPRHVLILAGKGNNAGDGFAVGRLLAAQGWRVCVQLTESSEAMSPLALVHYQALIRENPGVEIRGMDQLPDWPKSGGWVIDALLGLGAKGAPRDALATLIASHNEARRRLRFFTMAIDLPSGLVASAAGQASETIEADVTACIGLPKDILLEEQHSRYVGEVDLIPIFSEAQLLESLPVSKKRMISGLGRMPWRETGAHKGKSGRVLIVGGSVGMTGAPLLSALGALRAGSGLVTVRVPPEVYSICATRAPLEVMVEPWGEAVRDWERFDAVVVGPGWGRDNDKRDLFIKLWNEVKGALIVDADGLNVMATIKDLSPRGAPTLLTPHPVEAERLLGRSFGVCERERVCVELARRYGSTVVLKGVRSIVGTRDGDLSINGGGHCLMATGGSGDVLTGLIASMIGQKYNPKDAAEIAVWIHGQAALFVAYRTHWRQGALPSEIADQIPNVMVCNNR